MNLLFVMVGTSALENPEVGQAPDRRSNAALMGDVGRYMRSTDKRVERWSKLLDDMVKAHRRYWELTDDYIGNKNNWKQTSAELTSTVSLLKEVQKKEQKLPDKIVLLASDTGEGELAARVNEELFQWMFARVAVVTKRVEHLDVKFSDLTMSIEQLVNEQRTSGADQVVFNITGGYKGAIPSVTALALDGNWKLYYRHERSGDGVYLYFSDGKLRSENKPWVRTWG